MHDTGAAVAAAQVLAFYKEPVRYRPRLTHGHEPVQGGLHIFRFAQGRFPHSLLRDLSPAERERVREAAAFFIRQVCLWDGASHYQVLGVPQDARRETIKDHYHGLMGLLHPDRQEPASAIWPAAAAQRVNLAYAVLCDDAQRHVYDSGLKKSLSDIEPMARPAKTDAGPVRASAARLKVESRARMRTPILAVSAVAASLLFVELWWISDVPRDLALLSSAAPLDVSTRWVREALSSKERPRFLAASEARPPASAGDEPRESAPQAALPILTPLWQALSNRVAESREVTAPASPAPAPGAGKAETAAKSVSVAPVNEPAKSTEAGTEERVRPTTLAQSPPSRKTEPIASSPSEVRKADPVSAAAHAEMEVLVARLVAFYEAGDLERLLALYDASSVGVWEAMRLRSDYQEFFRNTRARRLRLNRLAWEPAADGAHARGEATVSGEYFEQPGKFERRVPIEVHATMRDGQLRITRLNLFPHES